MCVSPHPCCCAAVTVGSQQRLSATVCEGKVTVWAQALRYRPCAGGGTGRDTPFLAARVPPEAPRGLFPGSDAPSFLPRASRSPGATDTGPSRLVWETSLTESHSC